jgi:hypothetical protein
LSKQRALCVPIHQKIRRIKPHACGKAAQCSSAPPFDMLNAWARLIFAPTATSTGLKILMRGCRRFAGDPTVLRSPSVPILNRWLALKFRGLTLNGLLSMITGKQQVACALDGRPIANTQPRLRANWEQDTAEQGESGRTNPGFAAKSPPK